MTKRITGFLIVFAAALFLYGGMLTQVRATVPCPKSGCPKGACGYQGCGDKCHCRGGACGDWSRVCTYCDPNPCSDIYGSDWSSGRCNGQSNCEEERFECNCGNNAYYCHRTKKGPPQTPTPPPPTNTPPPPSPTPLQPTTIVTIPQPSPKAFSDKAVDPAKQTAQNWVCLKTVPCATGNIKCSGGDAKHRVQISTKDGAKMIPNKKTYIFECMQTDKGYRCTTGIDALDKELLGTGHLSALSSAYGYKYVAYTTTAGKAINQGNVSEVIVAGGKGDIGPLEWESSTTTQVGRIMMGMQIINTAENDTGNKGAQQQGTFDFGDEKNETTCIMIKWDPAGVVFDVGNYQPITGAKVTLMRLGDLGVYSEVKEGEFFGGVVNPQITDTDGAFAFYVPNGTYKLVVAKDGYVPYYSHTLGMNGKYNNIYDGKEIMTNGKVEIRNVAMRRANIFDRIFAVFAHLFK